MSSLGKFKLDVHKVFYFIIHFFILFILSFLKETILRKYVIKGLILTKKIYFEKYPKILSTTHKTKCSLNLLKYAEINKLYYYFLILTKYKKGLQYKIVSGNFRGFFNTLKLSSLRLVPPVEKMVFITNWGIFFLTTEYFEYYMWQYLQLLLHISGWFYIFKLI